MIRENSFKHDVYIKKWNINRRHFHYYKAPGELRVEILQTQ